MFEEVGLENDILPFHLNKSKKFSERMTEEVFVINSSQCSNKRGENSQIEQDGIKIKEEADELFLNCIKHEVENEEEEKQEEGREKQKDADETTRTVAGYTQMVKKLEIKCEPEICYTDVSIMDNNHCYLQELTTTEEEGKSGENSMQNKLTMTEEKNYLQKRFAVLCSFCQRTFHVAQNLQLHMTGTKYKVQCKFCSEGLVDSENRVSQKTTQLKLSTRCSSRRDPVVVHDVRKPEVPTKVKAVGQSASAPPATNVFRKQNVRKREIVPTKSLLQAKCLKIIESIATSEANAAIITNEWNTCEVSNVYCHNKSSTQILTSTSKLSQNENSQRFKGQCNAKNTEENKTEDNELLRFVKKEEIKMECGVLDEEDTGNDVILEVKAVHQSPSALATTGVFKNESVPKREIKQKKSVLKAKGLKMTKDIINFIVHSEENSPIATNSESGTCKVSSSNCDGKTSTQALTSAPKLNKNDNTLKFKKQFNTKNGDETRIEENEPLLFIKKEIKIECGVLDEEGTGNGEVVIVEGNNENNTPELTNNTEQQMQHQKRPFECKICHKRFIRKTNLKEHERVHINEYPFKCKLCKKQFKRSKNLVKHQKSHSSDRPFMCQFCSKRFAYKETLKYHEATHSTQERPFTCETCGKSFVLNKYLTVHLRSHNNERRFECQVCNKRFLRKEHLFLHHRVHTNERPHVCDVCNKPFTQKTSLKRHRETHGKNG